MAWLNENALWMGIALAVILALLILVKSWKKHRGQRVILDIDTSRRSGLAVKSTTAKPDPNFWVEETNDSAQAHDPQGDDLSRIKGVGPKLVAILKANGITRYAQIAAWSADDIAAFDARLGNFAGRPLRDQWVEQCILLAKGDTQDFERKFGALSDRLL